jgi:hypothetical protein
VGGPAVADRGIDVLPGQQFGATIYARDVRKSVMLGEPSGDVSTREQLSRGLGA